MSTLLTKQPPQPQPQPKLQPQPIPFIEAYNHFDRGVSTKWMRNWKDFVSYTHDMADFDSFIWRGHQCEDWKLLPTIHRSSKTNSSPVNLTEIEYLKKFKLAVRGRRGPNPATLETDNDWWALGQHHGLATPLLDWTSSPFIAAFFAFEQPDIENHQTEYRVVYALQKQYLENVAIEKNLQAYGERDKRKTEILLDRESFTPFEQMEFNTPIPRVIDFIVPHSDENHRLINQGGLFTKTMYPQPIDELIKNVVPSNINSYVLAKILIPTTSRLECLRMLNRMNINPLTLFPDLTGASKFCNLHREISNY